jgi:hypothetical protein
LSAATAPATLPVVKDVCGNTLTAPDPVITDNPASLTCEGTRTYTYTYEDCARLEFVWEYTYTIEKSEPVIASDGFETSKNISCIAEATEPTSAMIPSATNSCGEVVTPTMVRTTDWSGGKENCTGKIIYTYTYTDCGKTSTWSYTYNLNNTVAPTISLANGLSPNNDLACDPSAVPTLTDANFIVTDICDASATATVTSNETHDGCAYTRVYTATYTNGCGVSAEPATVTYTWIDAPAPTIGTISDVTATAKGSCKYEVPDLSDIVLAATTDNCGGSASFVSQSIEKNTLYDQTNAEQTIPVTVTVRGTCDKTSTATVNVIIPANTLNVTIDVPTAACPGENYQFTAVVTGAVGTPTYVWSGATAGTEQTSTITTDDTKASETYTATVTVTDGTG